MPGRARHNVHTLDLNFLGIPQTIAAYLIPTENGAVLIETGPGSTVQALQAGLAAHHFRPADVTDVFLTHIHLDHGGAAGWMARNGARIHVHPRGAPHLANPDKLLDSASRIYGDMMETLWGEFLPVPQEQISILADNQVIETGGCQIKAIDTPGHAEHHFAYVYEDICFSGDIGGVRLPGPSHLRIPMPPPEFHLEKWQNSIARLRQESFTQIAPTHFGIFSDAAQHLAKVERALGQIGTWMEALMPCEPSVEEINDRFMSWTRRRSLAEGIEPALIDAYEAANPSWMSAFGIQRYWRKHRSPVSEPGQ